MTPSTDANGGEPQTLPEPYHDRDGIRIYHARCEDVLPHIDPASVGLLLTDPPYGIGLSTDYGARRPGGVGGRVANGSRNYPPVFGDDEPFDPSPLLRYRRVVLWGANHYADKLPPCSGWLVWDRLDGLHTDKREQGFNDLPDAELAWTNCGGTVRTFRHMWTGVLRRSEIGAHVHPTQKPVALMRWIVEKWTKPGDLVLDPYMGSGPIAQACYELGRRYIGCEIVEDYCATAVKRLSQQVLPLEPA